jgi:hypothetical protein
MTGLRSEQLGFQTTRYLVVKLEEPQMINQKIMLKVSQTQEYCQIKSLGQM